MPFYAASGKELLVGVLWAAPGGGGRGRAGLCSGAAVLGMAVAVGPQIQRAPTLQKAHLLSRGLGGVREKKEG